MSPAASISLRSNRLATFRVSSPLKFSAIGDLSNVSERLSVSAKALRRAGSGRTISEAALDHLPDNERGCLREGSLSTWPFHLTCPAADKICAVTRDPNSNSKSPSILMCSPEISGTIFPRICKSLASIMGCSKLERRISISSFGFSPLSTTSSLPPPAMRQSP